MLREKAYDLLVEQGLNCSETILRLCDEAYGLHLNEQTYLALGVYGGGLNTGNLCGALAAATGVLGILYNNGEFNKSPEAKRRVKTFMERATQELGGTMCADLRVRYAEPKVRCLHLVEKVADLLEEIAK